ncbi:MAG TPA: alpha-glucuronidase family glycosyl hydrolase [Verrucomicrobiae bacterium]|jgi:alpha-glucuronidase|nr:alpha-glucuronidase family glycosyl hydrolase [Verrucomicrobiae bacterium]
MPTRFQTFLLAFLLLLGRARAETGYSAWLEYGPSAGRYEALPDIVVALGDSPVMQSARQELQRGLKSMLGKNVRETAHLPEENAIVIGTFAEVVKLSIMFGVPADFSDDGYVLKDVVIGPRHYLLAAGRNERGVLNGVFALLRKIALGELLDDLNVAEIPANALRIVNHWDNLNGTIERGYGGRSIFWENDHVTTNLARVGDYGRLLASIGVNGCSLNNVNADSRLLTPAYLPEVAALAGALRPWGVQVYLSVDFASPQKIGGLDTFDPLDPRVAAFWSGSIDRLYAQIPDFGGIVLKADSEGRVGPSAYHRTHADAANVIARALRPHGGVLFYRGFVYDHHMDWRNLKNDRARAAYDNFHALDGAFDDNVLVQIKHGPIDFQAREPVSPLFAGLEKTRRAIELQITQEYTGQQRHLCFLVPMWKEVLDFDLRFHGENTPVKALVAGKAEHQPPGAFVGVSNVGRDTNWLGSILAMANLYGFGRLAWNPDLSADQIAREWTQMTFGANSQVVQTISDMELHSWRTYENYTGPLGAQTLTDILGSHYGPGIEASEKNGWGQWHRADEQGIGMDRTVATGTGFIGQYPPEVARLYESEATCPDELLLFFHHVPYTHVLHSGKTVIQSIYDSHYEGAGAAAAFVKQWESLHGLVDESRYAEVRKALEYQSGHAMVWRDAICQYFARLSGIPDAQGRVGHHPNRVEAESMELNGYRVVPVTPWEDASGGEAIALTNRTGMAGFRYNGPSGHFDLAVQYFDQNNGAAHYRVTVNGATVDEWTADRWLPSALLDGNTSCRRTVRGIKLQHGDRIDIEGSADGGEKAGVDYVEVNSPAELNP